MDVGFGSSRSSVLMRRTKENDPNRLDQPKEIRTVTKNQETWQVSHRLAAKSGARYPSLPTCSWRLRNGLTVTLRPVCPADAALLGDMVQRLSAKSRYSRFHGTVNGLTENALNRMSEVDQAHDVALVVTAIQGGREIVVADARYTVDVTGSAAEFAIMVDDQLQGHGIAYRAMQSLADIATAQGLRWLHGSVRSDNLAMLAFMRRCGFDFAADRNDEMVVRVEKCIAAHAPARKASQPRFSVMRWFAASLIPDFI
jgi:RimJ/RimL family protein N-acetyltransferase